MENLRKFFLVVILSLPVLAFANDPIDINMADKDSLMMLNGVGEKRAEAIIEYREKYGPFQSIDQLTEVKGIGQLFVDTNRENLVVEKK